MAETWQITLVCDTDYCDNYLDTGTLDHDLAKAVGKLHDWACDYWEDYCPECAEED